jgi:putative transport protein
MQADIHASQTAVSLILLSSVAAGGLALGAVKVRGVGLGSAGVLFVGLLVGSFGFGLEPAVTEFLREFGLMLFVFTMGLQLGPGFFDSLRRAGLRLNLLAVGIVLAGALCTWLCGVVFQIAAGARLGLFSGSTTNTPSLGAAQQALQALHVPADQLQLPALAYSASYPIGIIGIIASLLLLKRFFRIDMAQETQSFDLSQKQGTEPLQRLNVRLDNVNLEGLTVHDLPGRRETGVIISRLQRAGESAVINATEDTPVHVGDHLLLIGTAENLASFQRIIGSAAEVDLMKAPGEVSFKRVVVTNRKLLGKSLAELGLDHLHGVTITRIVRAGVEMTAVPGVKLHFGDFLHVVGDSSGLEAASKTLGDSLLALNTTHFIPVFIGLALGVLIGVLPLSVPGLASPLKLGLAGGPLVVAILLSRLGRLGPLVWHMPANTNLAFRELGIALFLACVGLSAGPKFFSTVMSPNGVIWAAAALIISMVPLLIAGIIGRRWMRLNFLVLSGLLTGSMTDPPALAFANGLAKSEAPSIAYATVYPATMLTRIFMAQVMVLLFF